GDGCLQRGGPGRGGARRLARRDLPGPGWDAVRCRRGGVAMRSAALALSWQLWRRHRFGLASVAVAFVAAAVTFQLLPARWVERTHGFLASMLVVFVLSYVTAVFGYGFDGPLETAGSCFPSRQFALPVRTAVLAGWPMLLGVAAVMMLWAAWACFVLRPCGFD